MPLGLRYAIVSWEHCLYADEASHLKGEVRRLGTGGKVACGRNDCRRTCIACPDVSAIRSRSDSGKNPGRSDPFHVFEHLVRWPGRDFAGHRERGPLARVIAEEIGNLGIASKDSRVRVARLDGVGELVFRDQTVVPVAGLGNAEDVQDSRHTFRYPGNSTAISGVGTLGQSSANPAWKTNRYWQVSNLRLVKRAYLPQGPA